MELKPFKKALAVPLFGAMNLTCPGIGDLAKIRAGISQASKTLDLDDPDQAKLFATLNESEQALRKTESAAEVLYNKIMALHLQLADLDDAGERWKKG